MDGLYLWLDDRTDAGLGASEKYRVLVAVASLWHRHAVEWKIAGRERVFATLCITGLEAILNVRRQDAVVLLNNSKGI